MPNTSASEPQANGSRRLLGTLLVVVVIAVVGLLGAWFVRIRAAREALARCAKNEQQIGLAMHNFSLANGGLPAPARHPSSSEKHSWRVSLLPFLEQQSVFDRFDLRKPWNAPENLTLEKSMPPVYACPADTQPAPGRTPYQVVVGNDTMFPISDGNVGMKLEETPDGTSRTILFVEAHQAKVNWLEPKDLEFSQMKFQPSGGPNEIGSSHPGGVVVVTMADGSVHSVKSDTDPQVLRALFTRNGGEKVNLDN